jgi:flagellar FliL protein
MAENEDKETKEGEGGEEGEKKPSAIKALLVPVLASAVTSAIVGVILILVLSPKPRPAEDAGDDTAEHASTEAGGEKGGEGKTAGGEKKDAVTQAGVYLQYDPFIVTIFDHEKVHYLKATVSLELKSESVKGEIQAKDAQIRDSLIFVLGDFTLRELLDNQAKLLVKDVLIKTLNKIVGKDKILNVYFTEFTID